MVIKKYDENSIVTLGYRDAVRNAIGMYIGNAESGGMHHLLEEIVCNAMDEAAAGYGKEIVVIVESAKNKVTVLDHGRGIPFRMNKEGKYAIKEMCTSLHSGGKFENAGNYKSAIGLNGVGATVTNALSSYFEIVSVREDGSCHLEFINGNETDFKINDIKHDETGSEVSFIPDSKVFGDNKWNKEKILESLQIHAILNEGITFTLNWDEEDTSFCYKDGVNEYLKLKVGTQKPITNIIHHKCTINSGKADEATVELAIQYVNDGGERVYAFTNGAYNPDLGTHITGFRTAWTSLINAKAKELGLIDAGADNLDGTLIRKGMYLVLKFNYSSERPQFNEQQKLKLTSPSARAITSQAVGKMILPKADVEAIVKKALIEKKAEDAAQRKREAERKVASGGKNMSMLRELPASFADSIDRNNCELFIVEGDSAAGSAKTGRDEHKQAIFALRGKPLNTHSKELADIIKNEEIQNLLKVLGCGVGEKFNIKNLRYDKIIFMADADADGGHINCLLTTLFVYHLPELITAGKVYCAMPPLYRLTKGKERIFTSDVAQMNACAKKGYEVQRIKGLGEQNAEELWDSTMNPETRTLIPLTTDNMSEIIALYDILMGSSSKERKTFIAEHARQYKMVNEEISDEGDDE